MASKAIEKILIGVSVSLVVAGVSLSHPKISTGLMLSGVVSGSIFLFISPKPWENYHRRKQRLRQLRAKFNVVRFEKSNALKQLQSCSEKVQFTQSLNDLNQEIEQLTQRQQLEIENFNHQRKSLTLEVNDLRNLADEIANTTEREARIEAQKIKSAAAVEAQKIIDATKNSLNNTVLEPEKAAHLEVLQQIQFEKQAALSELERVQNLQEKTRAAIERMKESAQKEHLALKEKIKKQAQQQFLNEMERMQSVLQELENQINLLTTENQMLRNDLDAMDEPILPEGWNGHEIHARGIIEFYKEIGIKLDYKLSFKEGDRVVVRVLPREEKIGEQQLRKFSDRLQRKFGLSELPKIVTTAGTVQFDIRLLELQNPVIEVYQPLMVQEVRASSVPQLPEFVHPEMPTAEARSHLERMQQREFRPPKNRFSPFEKLSESEREWVLWLYNFCEIKDQNTIIFTVWQNTRGRGVTQGVGQAYMSAREKLHKIFDEAGIPRRKANNASYDI